MKGSVEGVRGRIAPVLRFFKVELTERSLEEIFEACGL